ncbi:hypothetical protein AB4259_02730 [Vibrio amylolyticus]|uniref:hypothetical protein n=1 Tax=Vibrio amylolyticus TaxID=2847292 RepID=UPI0035530D99
MINKEFRNGQIENLANEGYPQPNIDAWVEYGVDEMLTAKEGFELDKLIYQAEEGEKELKRSKEYWEQYHLTYRREVPKTEAIEVLGMTAFAYATSLVAVAAISIGSMPFFPVKETFNALVVAAPIVSGLTFLTTGFDWVKDNLLNKDEEAK